MVRVLAVVVVCALCAIALVGCDKDPVSPSSLASAGPVVFSDSAASPDSTSASSTSGSGGGSTKPSSGSSGSGSGSSTGSDSSGSSSSSSSQSAPSSPSPSPAPLPVSLPTVTGSIGTVVGSCPNLAFTVGANAIVTNQSTTFSGGQCSAFKIGDVVTAQGNVQADGSMMAQQVTRQ
jgi:Domain of unknown function (DUF5666)